MSTKSRLGSPPKTVKKTSSDILFLTVIMCTILLLGRTFIPLTNVMAEIIDGTRGDDILSGSKVSIMAVDGNGNGNSNGNGTQLDDFIYGDSGNDTIYGQDGSDHLSGGPGNDIIYGGNGGDYIQGGEGDDKIYGGEGDDKLVGGPGADFFDCGPGLDVVKDFNATEGDVHLSNCEMIQDDND
jgi:Ca2+-binding RTX toxin-like protein